MNVINLVEVLVDEDKSHKLCFLCFKENTTFIDIDDIFEVQDDTTCYSVSITIAMRELFAIDIYNSAFNQICHNCTTIILNIYSLINQYKTMIKFMTDKYSDLYTEVENKLQDKTLRNCLLNMVKKEIQNHNIIKKENPPLDREEPIAYASGEYHLHCTNLEELKKLKVQSHSTVHNATLCHICGNIFKSPTLLKSHLKCHEHRTCPHCFELLKSIAHFNVHMRKHRNEGKAKKRLLYKCDACTYVTSNKSTLEAHVNKYHLKVRPYICHICCKGCHKKSHLSDHLATHTDNKSEVCKTCGMRFVNKKCLTHHLRLHTGEKPYKCDICSFTFVTLSRLNEHVKGKHLQPLQICAICSKKFSLRKELNRHLRRVHKTTNTTPV